MAYLVAPFESASIVSAVAAAPVAVKVLAKLTLATPFVFHSLNGCRHLVRNIYNNLYVFIIIMIINIALLFYTQRFIFIFFKRYGILLNLSILKVFTKLVMLFLLVQ